MEQWFGNHCKIVYFSDDGTVQRTADLTKSHEHSRHIGMYAHRLSVPERIDREVECRREDKITGDRVRQIAFYLCSALLRLGQHFLLGFMLWRRQSCLIL